MIGFDVLLSSIMFGAMLTPIRGINSTTKILIKNLQDRYGLYEKVGKGVFLNFGSQIACFIRYSKTYKATSSWYGIEQDFLDGKTDKEMPAPIGTFGIFIWGDEGNAFVIPQKLISEKMNASPNNRFHILKRGEQFFIKIAGKELFDITDYLNQFPQPLTDEKSIVNDIPEVETVDTQKYYLREHTKIQYLLIKFGCAAGYQVWVSPQDRGLSYAGEDFSELTLPELPNFGFDISTRKIIQNIDVLWIERNIIHRAFEIESTTNVYSGLLRLSDLVLAQPNTNIDLNIVASLARRELVKKNILRPTFRDLRNKCSYISFEEVSKKYEIAKEVLKLQVQLRISLESEKF